MNPLYSALKCFFRICLHKNLSPPEFNSSQPVSFNSDTPRTLTLVSLTLCCTDLWPRFTGLVSMTFLSTLLHWPWVAGLNSTDVEFSTLSIFCIFFPCFAASAILHFNVTSFISFASVLTSRRYRIDQSDVITDTLTLQSPSVWRHSQQSTSPHPSLWRHH